MKQYSKPQVAREIEARARSKRLGVRLRVVEPQRAYSTLSQSEPGTVYTVSRTRQGWQCECPGFTYGGVCKHIGQVERRAERECWDFGVVAAIGQRDEPEYDERTRRGLALLLGERI